MNSSDYFSEAKLQHLNHEETILSPFAAKNSLSKGRVKKEEPCSIRTEFQRDRDRILHSKAFRRLKDKTQVFICPPGDHYRTRITHTLEVSQIARTIARTLRLNEDLTEAVSLGHDLGHTPFGHTGEEVLNSLLEEGFRHNEQSVRVVSVIENLNLTMETLDGILNHTGQKLSYTLEGQIVKIADRVAYLNHDIDDAIRAGIIENKDLPVNSIKFLGNSIKERIATMVSDIILNSKDSDRIKMSDNCFNAMNELRDWMFSNVYHNSSAKKEEHKARRVVTELFNYYVENFEKVEEIAKSQPGAKERIVADYIAGMTDRYAINLYMEKFVPSS